LRYGEIGEVGKTGPAWKQWGVERGKEGRGRGETWHKQCIHNMNKFIHNEKRFHLTPIRIASIKNTNKKNVGKYVGKKVPS
jgi:hypothetical protein